MDDIWYTFPATMGEDQAWITYNHGYADVSEADSRQQALRVRLAIKQPTDYGMPTNEEFPHLSAVDEALDELLTAEGAVYVGRVTVGGLRYFYFYCDADEATISPLIAQVAESSGYPLQYLYEHDKDKQNYWEDLFPTDDDWQVIQDLKVLDALAEAGDIADTEREIRHWAYFPTRAGCDAFASWVNAGQYQLLYQGKDAEGDELLVNFSHIGSVNLWDITAHTVNANRKARELGGRYDGWETSVECGDE